MVSLRSQPPRTDKPVTRPKRKKDLKRQPSRGDSVTPRKIPCTGIAPSILHAVPCPPSLPHGRPPPSPSPSIELPSNSVQIEPDPKSCGLFGKRANRQHRAHLVVAGSRAYACRISLARAVRLEAVIPLVGPPEINGEYIATVRDANTVEKRALGALHASIEGS